MVLVDGSVIQSWGPGLDLLEKEWATCANVSRVREASLVEGCMGFNKAVGKLDNCSGGRGQFAELRENNMEPIWSLSRNWEGSL